MRARKDMPIIMLTARAQESDKVEGLEAGADDYITKPFSPKELLARIKAVLRRRAPQLATTTIEIGGLRLDPAAHRVTGNGEALSLGPTEFKLLHFFMTHPERVYTRVQLLDQVWGDHVFVEERTVDVHIRRLRQALEPTGMTPDRDGARQRLRAARRAACHDLPPLSGADSSFRHCWVGIAPAFRWRRARRRASVLQLRDFGMLARWAVQPRLTDAAGAAGALGRAVCAAAPYRRATLKHREQLAKTLVRFRQAGARASRRRGHPRRREPHRLVQRTAEHHFDFTSSRPRPADRQSAAPAGVRQLHRGRRLLPSARLRAARPAHPVAADRPFGDAQKLLLSRDITRLEKLEGMRRDFVANVSHELRTPLTVLSGFLETIRELELDSAALARLHQPDGRAEPAHAAHRR